jgi:Nucleotidyl transferase AbiEii toxin, Type IV TA system
MTFKPHWEVLPRAQKEIWPALGWTTANRFVLYGGTAIALRCGHRTSIDFDFFTDQLLNQSTILQELRKSATTLRVVQDEKSSLTVVTEPGSVRLSFFGALGMGRVGTPTLTEDGIVLVASNLDLLGTKLKVIMQRAESKDYSDIAQLIGAGVSLIQGLGAARSLYGSAFAPAECLRALTFFDDGDLAKVNAETRDFLRTEAARASKVFPIPSIEKVSNQLSDEGIVGQEEGEVP